MVAYGKITVFQSTRPRGARQRLKLLRPRHRIVSIHAPAWGATISTTQSSTTPSRFNPRARVGRDATGTILRVLDAMFQSTRPRGARRLRRPEIGRVRVVSIHAPAWGATRHGARDNAHRVVSIHAPAWGATTTRWWRSPTVLSFNPRARVGRDGLFPGLRARQDAFQSTRPRGARHPQGREAGCLQAVSIHAPAWGATLFQFIHSRELLGFNPRARVGRDRPRSTPRATHRCCFNPRARVGRDLCRWSAVRPESQFQSTRPRGARRRVQVGGAAVVIVSIHAPAWGATRHCRGRRGRRGVSIHAPAWGATIQAAPHRHQQVGVSIHAPAWGATTIGPALGSVSMVSIHAPAWGATATRRQTEACPGVSIHAPAWGATAVEEIPNGWVKLVSIHAPAWGATSWPVPSFSKPSSFNPRARVGRDTGGLARFCASTSFNPRARVGRDLRHPWRYPLPAVSIHAPAWGATARSTVSLSAPSGFQSTRPRGARRPCRYRTRMFRPFQSTRPRGARRRPWHDRSGW